MQKSKLMNIVYIVDSKYVMPTCISIISVKQNKKSEHCIKVYVIANELSIEEKNIFQGLEDEDFQIHIVDITDNKYEELAEKCIASHVTFTALYKFDLPSLLEEDRVLYLDGDILVQGSLEELYYWDIRDYWLAAVDDMIAQKGNDVSEYSKRIGLKSRHYFNSGVLLLNLKQMREDHVSELLLDYKSNKINYFVDQDAFNYVCDGKRALLPVRFNYMITASNYYTMEELSKICFGDENHTLEECGESAVILHLTGNTKPWQYHIPIYTECFIKYYSHSVYSDKKLYLKSVIKYLLDSKNSQIKQSDKVWKFPYAKIEKGSKIVLYGAGGMGRDYYEQLSANGYCEIVLWVDKNYRDKGGEVASPSEINRTAFDYILVAVSEARLADQILDDIRKDFPGNDFQIVLAIDGFE